MDLSTYNETAKPSTITHHIGFITSLGPTGFLVSKLQCLTTIQVNLPSSLDAILFLAIAIVYQYFPIVLFHYELLIHVQLSNVESKL